MPKQRSSRTNPGRSNQSRSNPGRAHQLRIIGGDWRGRKLDILDLPGLRPTTDRVRETLFNWLQPIIPGAHCLDLFAGTGALGFEAASRGAARVTMIEQEPKAASLLIRHVGTLKAEQVEVARFEALAWLHSGSARDAYDVVFLDPPYHEQLLQPAIDRLAENGLVKSGGRIYFEHALDDPAPEWPQNWQLTHDKQAGQLRYGLVLAS